MVRAVGFARIHVFSYSPRRGTAAAELPDNVPPAVKAARREALRQLESELADLYYRSLLGRTLDVLVEGADADRPGHARGTACRYVPVSFRGFAPALLRQRVPVRVTAVAGGGLLGEPVAEAEPPSAPCSARFALPVLAAGR
ncbi:MAG: TRAM domain-containing protein [Gemmataceae bacterium]